MLAKVGQGQIQPPSRASLLGGKGRPRAVHTNKPLALGHLCLADDDRAARRDGPRGRCSAEPATSWRSGRVRRAPPLGRAAAALAQRVAEAAAADADPNRAIVENKIQGFEWILFFYLPEKYQFSSTFS